MTTRDPSSTSNQRPRHGWALTGIVLLGCWADATSAQLGNTGRPIDSASEDPHAALFRTGDGSSFLLVPLQTRSVHWVHLQPARIDEEPPDFPGLALAVTRASRLGPARTGEKTGENSGPFAWEKALRRAPSGGSRLVQIDDHNGIAVTFLGRSLGQVAQLMRLRTRRAELLDVQKHYAKVRAERNARVGSTPSLALIRRIFESSAKTRIFSAAFHRGTDDDLDPGMALKLYRFTHHPAKSIHVLVGGFDATFFRNVLRELFKTPVPEVPQSAWRSTKPRDNWKDAAMAGLGDTLILAYPLPDVDPAGLDLLVTLIAGDDAALLPNFLRAAGHPRVQVHAEAPYPAPRGVMLIRVKDPGVRLVAASPLVEHLDRAMAQLAAKPASEEQFVHATAVARNRRAAELTDQEALARLFARQWIRTGTAPAGDFIEDPPPSRTELYALARTVLARDSRILVLPRTVK